MFAVGEDILTMLVTDLKFYKQYNHGFSVNKSLILSQFPIGQKLCQQLVLAFFLLGCW